MLIKLLLSDHNSNNQVEQNDSRPSSQQTIASSIDTSAGHQHQTSQGRVDTNRRQQQPRSSIVVLPPKTVIYTKGWTAHSSSQDDSRPGNSSGNTVTTATSADTFIRRRHNHHQSRGTSHNHRPLMLTAATAAAMSAQSVQAAQQAQSPPPSKEIDHFSALAANSGSNNTGQHSPSTQSTSNFDMTAADNNNKTHRRSSSHDLDKESRSCLGDLPTGFGSHRRSLMRMDSNVTDISTTSSSGTSASAPLIPRSTTTTTPTKTAISGNTESTSTTTSSSGGQMVKRVRYPVTPLTVKVKQDVGVGVTPGGSGSSSPGTSPTGFADDSIASPNTASTVSPMSPFSDVTNTFGINAASIERETSCPDGSDPVSGESMLFL